MSNDTTQFVVNGFDILAGYCLLVLIACFCSSEVVVVSIRADAYSDEQPSEPEFFLMLINEPICH